MSNLIEMDKNNVFDFFEEICAIPHGSGNTKLISDYVVSIAKRNHLDYYQDDNNNVIVYKPACYAGIDDDKRIYNSDTVIIQGHLDMVCEKTEDCDIDFSHEPLRLRYENGFLYSEGTTLGGDDGIAVAYMLALMDSKDIPHPPLECVFTVDEEIGMLGAAALDMSKISGKHLLNVDSEEEGHLLISCAGGALATLHFPIKRRGAQGERYKIVVSGLQGGHSGTEIDKGRANADKVLGKILKSAFYADDSLRIISVNGGLKDNAIPVKAEAVIISKNEAELFAEIDRMTAEFKNEYKNSDPDICIAVGKCSDNMDIYPLDEADNLSFIMAYDSLPSGVIAMSEKMEGLVQTSLNLGIMETYKDEIVFSFCVRSSVKKEKQDLLNDLEAIVRSAAGSMSVSGDYPGWELKQDYELKRLMLESYKELYGKDMIVEALHAGVECGIFVDAIEGLDAVSFGPNIYDIHTPKERLDVNSAIRTWDFICYVLKKYVGRA